MKTIFTVLLCLSGLSVQAAAPNVKGNPVTTNVFGSGSAGQVLTSQGANLPPVYGTPAGSGDVLTTANNIMVNSNAFQANVTVSNVNGAAGIRLGTNGTITASSNISAFSFSGSGSNLTQILATNLVNGPRDSSFATNVPTRGYVWPASLVPSLGIDSWNTFQATFGNTNDWGTNVLKWLTNTTMLISTQMWLFGYDQLWITDGWQHTTRDPNGKLTWSTNLLGVAGIPAITSFAHTNKTKILLYTSTGPITCGNRPGSVLTNVYKDVQTMMAWDVDGCMWDTCNAPITADVETSQRYVRTINQAIEDYHKAVIQTNGIMRPFYVQLTSAFDNTTPDYAVSDYRFGANAININYQIAYASGVTNIRDGGRAVINKSSWIGPGHFFWVHSLYYSAISDNNELTNFFNVLSMTMQPFRGGLGDPDTGNATITGTQRITYENPEVIAIWRDPACIPPKIAWTNANGTEVWSRKLGALNSSSNAVLLINNRSDADTAIVLNVNDFGGSSNVAYTLRDVWAFNDVSNFVNATTITVNRGVSRYYTVREAFRFATVALTNTGPLQINGALVIAPTNFTSVGIVFKGAFDNQPAIFAEGQARPVFKYDSGNGAFFLSGSGSLQLGKSDQDSPYGVMNSSGGWNFGYAGSGLGLAGSDPGANNLTVPGKIKAGIIEATNQFTGSGVGLTNYQSTNMVINVVDWNAQSASYSNGIVLAGETKIVLNASNNVSITNIVLYWGTSRFAKGSVTIRNTNAVTAFQVFDTVPNSKMIGDISYHQNTNGMALAAGDEAIFSYEYNTRSTNKANVKSQ